VSGRRLGALGAGSGFIVHPGMVGFGRQLAEAWFDRCAAEDSLRWILGWLCGHLGHRVDLTPADEAKKCGRAKPARDLRGAVDKCSTARGHVEKLGRRWFLHGGALRCMLWAARRKANPWSARCLYLPCSISMFVTIPLADPHANLLSGSTLGHWIPPSRTLGHLGQLFAESRPQA